MIKTRDLNDMNDLIERIRRNSLKENLKNILLYSVFLYFPFILIILGIISSKMF